MHHKKYFRQDKIFDHHGTRQSVDARHLFPERETRSDAQRPRAQPLRPHLRRWHRPLQYQSQSHSLMSHEPQTVSSRHSNMPHANCQL